VTSKLLVDNKLRSIGVLPTMIVTVSCGLLNRVRTPSSEEPTPFLFTYEKPGSLFFPTWAGEDSLEENDHDDRVGDGTLKLANLLTRLGLLESEHNSINGK
jgi:hypothetical protein